MRRTYQLLVMGIILGLFGSQPAQAAKHPHAAGNSKSSNKEESTQTPSQNPPTTAPAADPTDQTNNAVAKAETDLLAAEQKAKKKYESSTDWTTAADNLAKAQSDADVATTAAQATVHDQPDYKQASAAVSDDEQKLQQARDSGEADKISAAATELMKARSNLTSITTRAAQSNPGVAAAQQKLTSAAVAMDQQRRQEDAAVKADPDWQAAKKSFDDARSKLASSAH